MDELENTSHVNMPGCSGGTQSSIVETVANTCVCCLAENIPLVRLANCKHVEFFDCSLKFKLEYSATLVCYACHGMLKNIYLFKRQVEASLLKLNQQFHYHQPNMKLLKLETSDIEIFHTHNSEPIEKEVIKAKPDIEIKTEIKIEIEDDYSDPENDVPLSEIKENKERKEKDPNTPFFQHKHDGKIKIVMLSEKEMLEDRKREASKEQYLKLLYKCEDCIVGYDHELTLKEHMEKRHNQASSKMDQPKKKRLYTEIQLQSAISAVKDGMMCISEASRKFGIPKATLHDKVNKKYPEGATAGAHSVLTKEEETQLVNWILYLSDVGFPVTKHNLINTVKTLVTNLKRANPFKDGKPGRHWYEKFMSRHPELTMRVSQSLTAPRAISEESIRAWFGRVETYLKKENLEEVLIDPRRIFNCDESAFYLSPKENSVIVKRGCNRVNSRAADDEKEFLTVLVTVSADGNMQPPLVIFPYKRTPASIILNMPPKWSIGRSDSGWMTGETFYEQITKVFYPWLIENNIPFPVILFMDGHSSHINLPLSEFCREKEIILIALLPNSTHRLQPLDVAVFRPLKHHWKEQRQTGTQNTKLRREDFSKALDLCIKNAELNESIRNGFRTCGLYPFDPNSIDYTKLIKEVETTGNNIAKALPTKNVRATATLLAEVEMRIPEKELEEFRMCGDTWLGDPKNHGLFYFWKKINVECLESDHEETLNANMNNLNRNDLDCNSDWLCNPEVLNMEVQPDGSLALSDMQLPNFAEHLALDKKLPCRSENNNPDRDLNCVGES